MSSPPSQPVSVHRAFIYGACLPGLGDLYAGARTTGIAILALFSVFMVGFCWILGRLFLTLIRALTDLAAPDLNLVQIAVPLGICIMGMYILWLWGILSATAKGMQARLKQGAPPQSSVAWAMAMAWLSPGTGHVYANARRRGYLLFGLHAGAVLLMIPGYYRYAMGIRQLMTNGMLNASDIMGLLAVLKDMSVRLEFSPFIISRKIVVILAIAETAILFGGQWPKILARIKTAAGNAGHGALIAGGLAVMGWLCPGSGQLLQQRSRIGWMFCGGYVGVLFLIALLLGLDIISAGQARTLSLLPSLVMLTAVIEAPVRMFITSRGDPNSPPPLPPEN